MTDTNSGVGTSAELLIRVTDDVTNRVVADFPDDLSNTFSELGSMEDCPGEGDEEDGGDEAGPVERCSKGDERASGEEDGMSINVREGSAEAELDSS